MLHGKKRRRRRSWRTMQTQTPSPSRRSRRARLPRSSSEFSRSSPHVLSGEGELLEDTEEEAEVEDACLDEDAMALPVEVEELPKKAYVVPELPPRLQLLKQLIEAPGGACEASQLTYPDFLRRLCQCAAANGRSDAARSKVSFTMKTTPVTRFAKFARTRRLHGPVEESIVVVDDEADGRSGPDEKVPMAPLRASEQPEPETRKGDEKAVRRELESAYKAPTAAVALLRKYFSQERFLGALNGALLFEADGVQYPLDTVTPMRSTPSTSSEPLSLGSLFAVAMLSDSYEGHATPALLKSLKARKLRSAYSVDLSAYLLGRTESCSLLMSASNAQKVPDAQPSLLNEDALGGRSKSADPLPVPLEELRSLPGQAEESGDEVQSPTEQFTSPSESTESEASEEAEAPEEPQPQEMAKQAKPKAHTRKAKPKAKKTEPLKPQAEAPKPKAETPKPKQEAPKPKAAAAEAAEAPKPKAEPPKPKAEPPKPKAEPPKPKAEAPKPKAEPPEPKAQAPVPKADAPKLKVTTPAVGKAPAPASTPVPAAPAEPAVPAAAVEGDSSSTAAGSNERPSKPEVAPKAAKAAPPSRPQTNVGQNGADVEMRLRVLKRKLLGDSAVAATSAAAKLQAKLVRLKEEEKSIKSATSSLQAQLGSVTAELDAALEKRRRCEEEVHDSHRKVWHDDGARDGSQCLDRLFSNLEAMFGRTSGVIAPVPCKVEKPRI
ncbi:avt5 [Symbiodinium natans]|uniref:Avt5 protein n=1 Tax=Symbiodinium natans TaxID=878477 RepID=A0A812KNF3_9DINO|nr:avt5 [Symbiodinium natans]